jgi:acyl-lipid omega-6 desaturase (Delta-12 desaturase)
MDNTAAKPDWVKLLRPFAEPNLRKAVIQLVDTILPFWALLAIMYLTILRGAPAWATWLLGIPAGAFMMRTFIIFHDCVHGSFVRSRAALTWIGRILGFMTFTPFGEWRYSHGLHHSTAGNLDRRGVGDVWTMTVDEYRQKPLFKRLQYRAYRNPFILFVLGPLFLFLVMNRIPPGRAAKNARALRLGSVLLNDLAIALSVAFFVLTIGWKAYLSILIPTQLAGGFAGIWLFYVQHQFDPSYWRRSEDWDSLEAALSGSSYYRLPAWLQWISGNIGLHHVHHLLPRIPNYNLPACLAALPELRLEHPLTLARSVGAVRLNLWDEASRRLVAFRDLGKLARPRGG